MLQTPPCGTDSQVDVLVVTANEELARHIEAVLAQDGCGRVRVCTAEAARDAGWMLHGERSAQEQPSDRERLEAAMHGSTDGFWDLRPHPGEAWDSSRTPVWFSPRFKEMLGFTGQELEDTLESWMVRLHPQDRHRVFAAFRSQVDAQEPLDVECRIRTRPGDFRWFRVRGQAIRDADGTMIRLAGSLQCITDRKRVEDALREAEERYRSIVHNAVEGMFQITPDGHLVMANPAFAAMLAYDSVEELLESVVDVGRDLYVQAERYWSILETLDREGVVRGVEVQFRRKDGASIWVSLNARADHAPGKAWRHYEGTAEDITQRKRDAERLARINECLLRSTSDADANITRLVRLCGELLQADWAVYVRRDEERIHAAGGWRTPTDLHLPGNVEGFLCTDVFTRGAESAWVLRHLHTSEYAARDPWVRGHQVHTSVGQAVPSGGTYAGALCAAFGRDFHACESDLRVLGIIVSAIAVEEDRRAASQALRQALRQTKLLFESLPSAVLVIQGNCTVVSANALACQFFGDGRQTLEGLPLSEIFPATEARRCRFAFRSGRSTAEQGYWKQIREFQMGERMFRYRCFPVSCVEEKGRAHTGLVVWDVTEDKQLQDHLLQTEKLASLGTMVSGMAHEINNPAQAILGLAELMSDGSSNDKVHEFATDIAGYARHIASVVRDFASYARATSREGETETDLNQRLINAVKMVRRGPHFGHIEVVTRFQSPLLIRVRGAEIEQVFVNLIGNAVQAMSGEGRLTLSTWRQGETICASIADTGVGIPKAVRHKIFDPFFTTKDPNEGTGLGLSIAHRIITKYGGRVRVESEEGRGTTFTLEFPLSADVTGGVL